jgi:hypothetical protein
MPRALAQRDRSADERARIAKNARLTVADLWELESRLRR